MTPEKEKELLTALSKGNQSAFDSLYLFYAPKVREFVFRLLKNPGEAEDVTQNIFLRVWEKRRELGGTRSLRSYLYTMARNAVFDIFSHSIVEDKYMQEHINSAAERRDAPLSEKIETEELALLIAVATALVQFAHVRGLRHLARFYIWIFRGTPLLVQLFIVFYGLSRIGIVLPPFPAAVIVFSLNEGAYCAETVRAALESVPRGQLEAGLCAGMSYMQTIRRIVLPQAMRTAFPPLSNSLIAMVKDTSLAANITVTEMFMVTQRIVARTYEPLLLYLEVGLIYLLFSTVLTKLQALGEKKLRTGQQKGV